METNIRLIELCDRIRTDPDNAGYWFLLSFFEPDEIRKALDGLDNNS